MAIHKRPVRPPTSSTHKRPVPQHVLQARREAIKAKQQALKEAEKAKAKQQFISGVISGQNKQRIDPRYGPGAALATGVKEAGKALVAKHPAVIAAKIAAAKLDKKKPKPKRPSQRLPPMCAICRRRRGHDALKHKSRQKPRRQVLRR